MENKKLELTLCGMIPYKLKGTTYYSEDDIEPCTLDYSDGINNQCDIASWLFGKNKTLPHLHSIDKLSDPILKGGLIPIIELAKMTNLKLNWAILDDGICGNNFYKFAYRNGSFVIKDSSYRVVENQLELFEKLKEWHFNIYDLPKKMYIEKSTIN